MSENEEIKSLKIQMEGADHVRRAIAELEKYGISIEDVAKKVYTYTKNLVGQKAVMEWQIDAFTKMAVNLDKTNGPWKVVNTRLTENTQKLKENLAATRELNAAKEQARLAMQFVGGFETGAMRTQASPAEELRVIDAKASLNKFITDNQVSADQVKLIWESTKVSSFSDFGDPTLTKLQALVYAVQQTQTQMGDAVREEAIKENAIVDKSEQQKLQSFKHTVEVRMAAEKEAARVYKVLLDEQRRAEQQLAADRAAKTGATIGSSLLGRIDLTKATAAQKMSTINAIEGIRQFATQNQISLKQVDQMWAQLASGNIKQYTGATQHLQSQLFSLQQQTKNFGQVHQETTKSMLLSWQSIGRILAAQVLRRVFFEMVAGLQQSVTTAKELSLAIAEIRTVSQRAQLATKDWSAGLFQLSNAFGLDVLDQAEGAYQALSNQVVQGAEAFNFMAEANKFAIATVSTTEQSVNLLSSVINAYGMSAKDAEYISAVLFKTIELGRVRAEEMANTFGNIAVLAAQVGVTFEELTASISTLTIQGVKYSQAATQIRGILQKLIQPTKEMKVLFKEIGVESGDAAIEVYGLDGFLMKMREHTKGSATEMSKLISRVRGISGALGLTNDGVKRFRDNLKANEEALESYRQAIKDSFESTGRTVEIEMTRIKNVFTQEFGGAVLKKIAELSKDMGGLDRILKALAETVGGALTNSVTQWTNRIVVSALTIAAFSRLMRTANPWIMAAEGIAIATGYLAVYLNKLVDAKEEEENRRQAETAAMADDAEKRTRAVIRAYEMAYEEVGRIAKRAAAQAIAQENRITDAIVKRIEAGAKAIEKIHKAVIKSLDAIVDEFEKDIEASQKVVEKLSSNIADSLREQADMEFEIRFKLDDKSPGEVIQTLNAEIERLQKEYTIAFQGGDVEVAEDIVKRVFKLYNRIIKITDDAQKKRTQLNKQAAEIEAKHAKASGELLDKLNKTINPTIELLDKEREINKERNDALAKIDAEHLLLGTIGVGEKSINETIKARRDILEDINRKRKEAIELEQKHIKELEVDKLRYENIKQSLIDISTEARAFDLGETLAIEDPEKRIAALDKQLALLREQLSIKQEPGISTDVERARLAENIEDHRRLVENQKVLADMQIKQKAINDLVEQGKKAIQDAGAVLVTNNREYAKQQGYIKRVAGELETFNKQTSLLPEHLARAATEGAELGKKLSTAKTISEVAQLTRELTKLKDHVVDSKALTEDAIKSVPEIFKFTCDPMREAAADLLNYLRVLEIQANKLGGANQYIIAMRDFEKASQEAAKYTEELLKRQGEQSKDTKENIKGIVDSTRSAVSSVTEFTRQLLVITDMLTMLRTGRIGALENEGLQPKAKGGMMRMHGSDRIPALLSPGEFVVNARSTRKFFSQLSSINAGSVPRFEHGGQVTTNVGDINVSLHSTGSEAVDIVKIGNGLRRAIRQGRVKL